MKKKITALFLAVCMAMSFTACMDSGSSNDSSSEVDSSSKGVNLKDIKEGVDSVKEIVSGAKEIVSDAKEIKSMMTDDTKAKTPLKAKKCEGENYEKIKKEFESAGFTNITANGNGKLKIGLLHSEGDIETISINGDKKFGKGDKFPKDAEITITYYSK